MVMMIMMMVILIIMWTMRITDNKKLIQTIGIIEDSKELNKKEQNN